jgi:UDP-N-acetylmuramoyl-tripeptide--D-alanyl-D-alanine ligase
VSALWTSDEVARALAPATISAPFEANGVTFDSRAVAKGDLLLALSGQTTDGHAFVGEALKRGAAAAVVSRDVEAMGGTLIRVPDTMKALVSLGRAGRRRSKARIASVTGSVGKTSTKDALRAMLAAQALTSASAASFNNHVGVPISLARLPREARYGVFEIGMNHPGEIAPLAHLAQPDVAIITNIGIAHLEFMGTRAAIAHEKGDLAAAVPAGGTVILNRGDEFADAIARRTSARVIFAGVDRGEVQAREIVQTAEGAEFTILEGAHRCHAVLPVPGLHMVQNALLAIATGRVFGLSLEECAAGLAAAPITKARLQIKNIGGVQFIDDSYNANPDSTKAALHTLVELETDGQRIAVLGQMAELGAESVKGHREVGQVAAALGVDRLFTLGPGSAEIATAARAAGLTNSAMVASAEEVAELLCNLTHPGDLVLVKGSRSARTERVLEEFAKRQLEIHCTS